VKTIYLASGNDHKAREFQALAERDRLGVAILSARAIGGMPPVPEDTGTFAGNARQKALALAPRLPAGTWALADDSGLCVDALDGSPGVNSAIFAGPAADGAANLAKLIQALREVPEKHRQAHFICVLVLAGPAPISAPESVPPAFPPSADPVAIHEFTGRCDGRLLTAPRGQDGFGYDPLFVPSGHDQTFAELPVAGKNTLSHRAQAWAQLAHWLKASAP
jgi:XTP/dITP diphosphohydrolase